MRRPQGATFEAVLDMMMEGILIALLVFTPLAFGTVHTWAVSLMQAVIVLIFALWLIRLIWSRPSSRPTRTVEERGGTVRLLGYRFARTRLGTPIALFSALVALQIVPLPPSVVKTVSPGAAEVFGRSLPGYAEGAGVDFRRTEWWLTGNDAGVVGERLADTKGLPVKWELAQGAARPISLYPFATATRLLMLIALVMVFLVVVHVVRGAPSIERISWVVTLTGLGISVLGMVQRLQWNGRIYWFYPVTEDASPYGPFLNHNHFAAYLEMAIPLSLAMFLSRLSRLRDAAGQPADGTGAAARRVFLSVLRRGPEAVARLGMGAFSVVVMVAALALSGSRGAVLSLAGALTVYGAVMAARRQLGRAGAVAGLSVLAAGLVFSAWVGAARLGELGTKLRAVASFESEPSLAARMVGWRYTLGIVGDYPALGSGLGTFADAWLHYYPPGTGNVWKEAHNDYLQIAAETGAAGVILLAWGLIVFLRRYLFRNPTPLPGAPPGGGYLHHGIAVGVLSILLHSWVDFSLQVAAIALLFVVLSGIMVGETTRRMEALQ